MERFNRLVESLQPSRNASLTDSQHSISEKVEARKLNILLTGSTGNLGAYILDILIADSKVSKIVCLNRSANAKDRQIAAQRERGLNDDLDPVRVTFLEAVFTANDLGLDRKVYDELTQSIDVVIHNAWPVDFNRNFSSFRPSIDGLIHLTSFCTARCGEKTISPGDFHGRAGQPIKIIFVSSVAATSNWGSAAPTARSEVPEAEITDWKTSRTGYGQSKLFAERWLSHASRSQTIPTAVVRVGQLSGPVLRGLQGSWPEREWLPSLIRSSYTLGVLPKTLGPSNVIDWIPVDLSAQIIVELAMWLDCQAVTHRHDSKKKQNPRAEFFHCVNPRETSWSSLITVIKRHGPCELKMVTFVEWVDILKDSFKNNEEDAQKNSSWLAVNPACKLIDFFDHLQDRAIRFPDSYTTPLQTKRSVTCSPTLAKIQAVGPEWMDLWLQQWNWAATQGTVH